MRSTRPTTSLFAPPVKVLVAGPMTSEDGEKQIGSMLLIEANSLEKAT